MTFDGPVENPKLDIRALYNVQRAGDQDLGVIVTLQRPLVPYPGIDFTSNADYEIAPSDLVSYLLTGKPGFDYGANAQASQVLASFLAPTLSAYAADQLRQVLGSRRRLLQFQLGIDERGTGANGLPNKNTLTSYSLQLDDRRGPAVQERVRERQHGFCELQSRLRGIPRATCVGAKAEYRFNSKLSMKVAYDPGTAGRVVQRHAGLHRTSCRRRASSASRCLHTWRF